MHLVEDSSTPDIRAGVPTDTFQYIVFNISYKNLLKGGRTCLYITGIFIYLRFRKRKEGYSASTNPGTALFHFEGFAMGG